MRKDPRLTDGKPISKHIVEGLLGHAQPNTTLDIYSHTFDSKKKAEQVQLWERLEM